MADDESDVPIGTVPQPREGDFFLPWPIGGVRRKDDRTLMVEIEHDLLVVLVARATVETERQYQAHINTPNSGVGKDGYWHQNLRSRLQRDIFNYKGLGEWLQRLTVRRPSW